jgi:hypothetical protein
MKNLKIEEIAKLEHCECESPCGACLEKYAHVFEKDEENIASVSATNMTGDAIANYVLKYNAVPIKSGEDIIQDLIKDVEKLKEQVSIILMTIK